MISSEKVFDAVAVMLRDRAGRDDSVTGPEAEQLANVMVQVASICDMPDVLPRLDCTSLPGTGPQCVAVSVMVDGDAAEQLLAGGVNRSSSPAFQTAGPTTSPPATDPKDFKWPADVYEPGKGLVKACMDLPAGRERLWRHVAASGVWPTDAIGRIEFEATILYCFRTAANPGAALTACIRGGHHGQRARYIKEDLAKAGKLLGRTDGPATSPSEQSPAACAPPSSSGRKTIERRRAVFNELFPVGSWTIFKGRHAKITHRCELIETGGEIPMTSVGVDSTLFVTLGELGVGDLGWPD